MEKENLNKYLEIGERPWGKYFVLENENSFKVKKILVNPKSRLSLQNHKHRQEFWVVVKGVATIEIGEINNLKKMNISVGEFCHVPVSAMHRLSNESENENLEIIEVQTGTYFGEDDIIRFEDDYNRIT